MTKDCCGRHFVWPFDPDENPYHDTYDPECDLCDVVNSDAPDWTL